MPSVTATLQAPVGELQVTNAAQQATTLEHRATITQLQERILDLEAWMWQHTGSPSNTPSTHPINRRSKYAEL